MPTHWPRWRLPAPQRRGRHVALRAFELRLLRELGVLPELSTVTLAVTPVHAERSYALDAEAGVLPAPAGEAGLPGAALVRIEAALRHGNLSALRQAVLPGVAALRGPLRALLHYHLGSATLRTRQVMWGMQRLVEPDSTPVPANPSVIASPTAPPITP